MSLKYGDKTITDIYWGTVRITKRLQNEKVLYEYQKPDDHRFRFYNPTSEPATIRLETYKETVAGGETVDNAHIKIIKSEDSGKTWDVWCDISGGVSSEPLTILPGQVVYMRGNNDYFSSSQEISGGSGWYTMCAGKTFKITGQLECHGDLMDLMEDKNNIKDGEFYELFSGCKGLLTAPDISGNGTVGHFGCSFMFSGCKNLSKTPEKLMFTQVANDVSDSYNNGKGEKFGAYYYMFNNCINITESPVLGKFVPAGDYQGGFFGMFFNCNKLNKVTVLWDEIRTSGSSHTHTEGWLYKVSPTGTFIKPKELQTGTGSDQLALDSASGIPTGWTVENV